MELDALGQVSSALLGALDADQVLQRLADLVIPRYADQAIIDVIRADGTVRRRIISGDPAEREHAALLERTAPPVPHPTSPAAAVLRGEGPQLRGAIDERALVEATPGPPERHAAVRALAPLSAVAVPLPGREGVLGSLTLLTTGASGRRFCPDDVSFVVELGVRAGSALEGALLHERVVETSTRLAALQRFTSRLASAEELGEVAALAVDAGADVVTANSAYLCLVDPAEDAVTMASERSLHPESVRRFARFALSEQLPVCDAIRTRAPVLLRSIAERDERYPALRGAPAVDHAYVIVPLLLDEDTPLGALAVGFSDDDVVLDERVDEVLLAVGRQTALALERTRLAGAERRALARQRFLREASDAMSRSLDLRRTLGGLTELLVPGLADSASVHLFDEPHLSLVAQVHVDPEALLAMQALHARTSSIGPDPIMLEVARTGQPRLNPAIPAEMWRAIATDEDHLGELLRLRLGSGMVVALSTRGRSVGLLTLGRTHDRSGFTDEDLSLVLELAERAAVAIENALAHEERDAQARALQAALLPPALPEVQGLDLAVSFRPVGEGAIGGDLYDVFPVQTPAGEGWMVVVGDVCGKGAEAAAVTALVRWTVRTAAKVTPSPAAVLATCNQVVADADLGERFATVAVAVLTVDPAGGGARVRLASGGHPLPMVRHLNGDAVPAGRTGPLLGIFEGGEWPESELELHPGEALLAFTDGLLEARSPSGAFAPQLLEQVLHATLGAGAAATAAAVLDAVDALEQGVPRDDLAFLIAQVPPAQTELVHVHVEGTPTAAAIRMDEHLSELQRELELVRLGEAEAPAGTGYARRVLTVLGGILERFAEARASLRDQAELATLLGQQTFTAELLLPPLYATVVEEMRTILLQVAAFSERGELLTLPPDPATIQPTMAWFDEVARQLQAAGDPLRYSPGAEPTHTGDRLGSASVPVGPPPPMTARRRAALNVEQRPDMARAARRFVHDVLASWDLAEVAHALALPVTELVTNAQIHARTDVELVVLDGCDLVRVEVHDASPDLPVIRSRDRTAGTGRGLALVAALAHRWGVDPTRTGKRAWIDVKAAAVSAEHELPLT